jgi:hypothetical protein
MLESFDAEKAEDKVGTMNCMVQCKGSSMRSCTTLHDFELRLVQDVKEAVSELHGHRVALFLEKRSTYNPEHQEPCRYLINNLQSTAMKKPSEIILWSTFTSNCNNWKIWIAARRSESLRIWKYVNPSNERVPFEKPKEPRLEGCTSKPHSDIQLSDLREPQ